MILDTRRRALLDLLAKSPVGDRIEFGVYLGGTLTLIADHDGFTIGVDSFQGMPEPGARDWDEKGNCQYPKGRLACPMRDVPGAELVKGFVPAVLDVLPDGPYAFAHIDMDQYDSTAAALEWVWPRMISGGYVVCDDWFADRDFLAGGAINDFAKIVPMTGHIDRIAWFVKP